MKQTRHLPEKMRQLLKQTRYLLFTGLVKHGEMLHYLLAGQVRKRLMEQHRLYRQVKSSAVTGNPDRVFEIYYVAEPDELEDSLTAITLDPIYQELTKTIDATRITLADREVPLDIPPHVQMLSEMPYLFQMKSELERSAELAEEPYLLHVTVTLHKPERLGEFNGSMFELLKEFECTGMHLLMAGKHTGVIGASDLMPVKKADPGVVKLLHIWQYEDPESPRLLMTRLAENQTYAEIDKICDQDQHICRNVSRHYQNTPLLAGRSLSP